MIVLFVSDYIDHFIDGIIVEAQLRGTDIDVYKRQELFPERIIEDPVI